MSVIELPIEMEIGGLVEGCERDHECISELGRFTESLETYVSSGSPLCPEELLLYALMKLCFKTNTFTKHHSILRYESIAFIISKICGVQFAASSIRRFFPRVSKNELKSNVGKENGKVRWCHFTAKVEEFIRVSGSDLESLLNCPETIPEVVVFSLNENLKGICSMERMKILEIMLENGCNFTNQFNTIVKQNLSTSSDWIPWFNSEMDAMHLYSFGSSPGYAEKEIRLSETFEWTFYTNGIEQRMEFYTNGTEKNQILIHFKKSQRKLQK